MKGLFVWLDARFQIGTRSGQQNKIQEAALQTKSLVERCLACEAVGIATHGGPAFIYALFLGIEQTVWYSV
jgi:hypothetical protein